MNEQSLEARVEELERLVKDLQEENTVLHMSISMLGMAINNLDTRLCEVEDTEEEI